MNPHTAIRRLERFAAACGAPVVRNALMAGVLGRVEERRIVLRKNMSPQQQLCTLAHELTHLLMHCCAEPPINRTVCEYEAEAVERWVSEALQFGWPAENFDGAGLTEDLLACSVERVRRAAHVMLLVVSGGAWSALPFLQAQSAVQIDASTGEEIVFNDKLHRMRDFVRLTEPL